ncbi:mucin-4-like isoform X2 [Acanthochromis polyacanthus]|uniref:mucin-4-like isoform X2 n=1 Tax=Acanthochromis polyacanthus TaxID=80966 RepID=UPI0022344439|nr:mucin-4-like isoform X2 [Acanthochromis polyacanthus]
MCERGEPLGEGELRNNNRQGGVLTDSDANANAIQTEDGGRTGETGSLSGLMTETAEQDKVIIWGTDSQCDDPELAEFEMLECQELEAYLVEDGEDFVGLAERKELQEQPSSCRKSTIEQATDNKSRQEGKSVPHGASEQESSHVSESREASRTELSSETDVFVSCLSTISSLATAMDTTGRTQMTDSWHMASGPHSTISEDMTLASQTCATISESKKASARADHPSSFSRKSTIHQKDVNLNLNSTLLPEEVASQAQVNSGVLCKDVGDEHRKNNNRAGNAISVDKYDDTEHKVSPSATKTHEESNTKMDKSTQADETPGLNYGPPKTGTKGTQSSVEPKVIKKQGSFDNTLKKQNSFDRSYKKQPSFENTLKKQLSFDNSLKKQGSFENTNTSSSSSLERRKPWGSPSRPAAPSSPKTTSCSPKRRPPGSPAKVQGIRALSLERSDSPLRDANQTVKPPGKTSLSSGIPKPVIPQQKEAEPRRSSPPQKPKNVRPKIITYIRKSAPAKPEAPHEASTHPPRLSSYSNPPAHKDPKGGPQPKSTPVLCSSNLLFDKYRQEMQKAGYYPPGITATGMKPPSSSVPQRLGGKSDSFHEEMSEKYLQEHVPQDGGSVYRSPRTLRPQLGLGAVTRQPAAKTRVQPMGQRSTPATCQSAQTARAGQDLTEQKRPGPETTRRVSCSNQASLVSVLRASPPFQLPVWLPSAFVRSSSVSSVSSNQSNDSSHSDPADLLSIPAVAVKTLLFRKPQHRPAKPPIIRAGLSLPTPPASSAAVCRHSPAPHWPQEKICTRTQSLRRHQNPPLKDLQWFHQNHSPPFVVDQQQFTVPFGQTGRRSWTEL